MTWSWIDISYIQIESIRMKWLKCMNIWLEFDWIVIFRFHEFIGSIRDKSGRGKVAVVALPVDSASGTLPRRIGSFRDKTLPPSPLAAGILRHHSLATGKGNLVQRTVIQSAQTALVAAATAAAASVSGVTLPVGAKCKPRLTRQVAIHEEKIERYNHIAHRYWDFLSQPSNNKSLVWTIHLIIINCWLIWLTAATGLIDNYWLNEW